MFLESQALKSDFQKYPIALYTDFQINGKGQLGNSWESSMADNLALTLAIPIGNADLVQLNKAISGSILKGVQNFCCVDLKIKWPNDIVVTIGDRADISPSRKVRVSQKLAGILMEVVTIKDVKFLLVGLGVNINQTHWDNLPLATSLRLIEQRTLSRELVANCVIENIGIAISSPVEFVKYYDERLWRVGERVEVVFQNIENAETESIFVKFKAVDAFGRIVLEFDSGEIRVFHHGEARLKY